MGKFSAASNINTELDNIQKLAQATTPVQQQPEQAAPAPEQAAPAPGRAQGSAIDALLAKPTPEEQADLTGAVDAGIQEGLAVEAEAERQAIPPIRDRAQQFGRVDRWLKPPTTQHQADGGINARAKSMAMAAETGALAPSLTPAAQSAAGEALRTGGDVATAAAADKEGSLIAAIERSGAVMQNNQGKRVPNQQYSAIASAVTENMIADLAYGEEAELQDPVQQALGEEATLIPKEERPATPVKKAQGNAKLGQQIHQEYQRAQGIKTPEKLPRKEAETLGDAYKELWAANNPELIRRIKDTATGQVAFQLTGKGQAAIEAGATDRKRIFPKVQVRPAKTPLPKGQLPGDVGQNVVKRASGRVGEAKFGNVIQSAVQNMATVPNVVDKQRGKILLATILPVLTSGDHSTWQAEINNFGPSKIQKYAAAQKDQQRRQATDPDFDEEPYSPEATMAALTDKIAQEVRAVATEKNGANYLTYGIQAFNGRIAPQQTFFDPTTSKAVRFVTRNAVPAKATPGSRIDKNLRQMYAMMLVKGADAKLPEGRELALRSADPQLRAWGGRLNDALAMTDEQYEAVSAAIAEGIALDDPNFPQFDGLDLDPEADAALIKAIESKGEDGPHFIDGLIDYAKYAKARDAGQPYQSYFNAYIDGKTNGLASNGIQMGHMATATATGVIRKNARQLLDNGDIRDQLKEMALESVDEGWDGDVSEYEDSLNTAARALFSDRNFNKATTMTFGYGKEINSFKKDIEDTLSLLVEQEGGEGPLTDSLLDLDNHMNRSELAETLLIQKYEPALRQVLSDDAIETRGLMRGAAMLHAATNQLFSIKSYVGLDINLGRDVSTGADGAEVTRYGVQKEGKTVERPAAFHYETEATSSASRNLHGDLIPGEYAYGGALPGPVQSLDAATVALTASGKSWEKLKSASNGNPYLHTIYDAFKLDAAGYDVAMEEINENWLNASMDWSYLQATLDATKEKMSAWREAMTNRKASGDTTLTPNERVYMDWMLKPVETASGRKSLLNFVNKTSKVVPRPEFNDHFKVANQLEAEMRKVGYDVNNPPITATITQLETFVNFLNNEMNLRGKLQSAITKTNNNKKILKREIQKRGHKLPNGKRIALQYYAH